jgi:hypothetical protein
MSLQKFTFRTNRKPVTVVVSLIAMEPTGIYITGYDPFNPNTEYFSRRIDVKGTDRVEFNCPQSPLRLRVIVWSEDDKKFTIPKVEMNPLYVNFNMTEDEKKDIKLIENFSRSAGRIPARRTYVVPGAKFKIEYKPVILRDDGSEHPTPARIHTELPLVQVSKKHFNKMTVPQRVAILLHEYAHNFLNYNQDDEVEADNNMVMLYEGLGYPRLEAVYAFTGVMNDTNVNVDRVNNIMRKL